MRCIELFAGAGGAALGLHRAGVCHDAHVEMDPSACDTLRALDIGPVLEGDVRAVDWTPYAGRCDLLWASPPCQAWSQAGKRKGAEDERNGWPWTWAAVDAIKPTWLICENVPGLLSHRADCLRRDVLTCPGCYWIDVILPEARRRFAYVDARTLDAADFGAPQRRHRVFLVCGPERYAWPRPTHSAAELARAKWDRGDYWERHGIAPVGQPTNAEARPLGMLLAPGAGLLPWRTVRDALGLGHLSERQSGMRGLCETSVDRPGPTVQAGSNRDSGLRTGGYDRLSTSVIGGGSNPHRPRAPDERTYRDLTDEPSTTVAAEQIGNAGPWVVTAQTSERAGGRVPVAVSVDHPSPLLRAQEGTGLSLARARYPAGQGRAASEPERLDAPSPSVTGQEVKGTRASESSGYGFHGGPDRASDAAFLATGIRRLTTAECATLQGFPPDHPWRGTKTSIYRQIGNACVPAVVEALARALPVTPPAPRNQS